MDEQIKDTCLKIIESETGLSRDKIDVRLSFREFLDLDSVQLVNIAANIEEELNIELPMSIQNVNTLEEFFFIVSKEIS